MADKPLQSGDAEAVGFVTIKFLIQKSNEPLGFHEEDCPILSVIGGLKEDLEQELRGPKEHQKWYHNGVLMEDDKSLLYYKIKGYDEEEIIVQISD